MSTSAKIYADIGVKSWKRYTDEPFMPSRSWNETFHFVTTTDAYTTETDDFALEVFNYAQGQITDVTVQNTINIHLTVENATHPTPAAGVVAMPKQHIDLALSGDELTSAAILTALLNTHIANLITKAKY